jgi:hypothetical protein
MKTYLWCKLKGKGICLLDHAVSFNPFSQHGGECQVGRSSGQIEKNYNQTRYIRKIYQVRLVSSAIKGGIDVVVSSARRRMVR